MSATEEKLSYEEVSAYLEKFKEINSNTSKSDIKELLQDSIGASMTPRDNVVEIKK